MDASDLFEDLPLLALNFLKVLFNGLKTIVDIIFVSVAP